MPDALSGTVTFLFTDIAGSTRLWDEHAGAMRGALRHHDDLSRACIEGHGGRVFKTVGDAFCAVFPAPRGAIDAVLASEQWLPAPSLDTPDGTRPLKVRVALHIGAADQRESATATGSARRQAVSPGCRRLDAVSTLPLSRCASTRLLVV